MAVEIRAFLAQPEKRARELPASRAGDSPAKQPLYAARLLDALVWL